MRRVNNRIKKRILELRLEGLTGAVIALRMDVSIQTVFRIIKENKGGDHETNI